MKPLSLKEIRLFQEDGLTPVQMWKQAMCLSTEIIRGDCVTLDGMQRDCDNCRYYPHGD